MAVMTMASTGWYRTECGFGKYLPLGSHDLNFAQAYTRYEGFASGDSTFDLKR